MRTEVIMSPMTAPGTADVEHYSHGTCRAYATSNWKRPPLQKSAGNRIDVHPLVTLCILK
jgi:hypothetical protein